MRACRSPRADPRRHRHLTMPTPATSLPWRAQPHREARHPYHGDRRNRAQRTATCRATASASAWMCSTRTRELQAHLWGTHTDADFYNPNSLQSAGESQYGLKASLQARREGPPRRRRPEDLRQCHRRAADRRGSEARAHPARTTRSSRSACATARPTPSRCCLRLPCPARSHRRHRWPRCCRRAPTTRRPVTPAALAKVTVPVPDVKGAEVFALAEKAVDGTGEEYGVGGTYALNATTHLYAQHDFINSLNGPYTLNPQRVAVHHRGGHQQHAAGQHAAVQ